MYVTAEFGLVMNFCQWKALLQTKTSCGRKSALYKQTRLTSKTPFVFYFVVLLQCSFTVKRISVTVLGVVLTKNKISFN